MHSLVIFASGGGTNAKAIIEYFKQTGQARVHLIVCNKPGAGVLNIAKEEGIETLLIDRDTFKQPELLEKIQGINPTLVVLAGFLWKIPDTLVQAFPDKIINIHPALLPKYGGKGMYGHHVHEAVVKAAEKESGITIHYVNEVYDSGDIIVQARCKVSTDDTPDSLAANIHNLEHFYFPRTIEFLLKNG
ncbi:MAG: phosphoribosylglycinamide formyltransferase [Sphingobacteriales bacterium]|nr:MAG: phosphoribosylglycinamide formyltransferase [Sphingobacteriales bacterium]